MRKLWRRMLMLSAVLAMVMTVHAFADNTIQYCASTFTFTRRGTQVSKQFTVATRTNITVHIKMFNNSSPINNKASVINYNTNFMLQNANNPSQVLYLTDKNYSALEYDVHMTVEAGTYTFAVQNNQDYWFNLYFRVTGSTGIDILDDLELTVGSSQTISVTQQSIYGGNMVVTKWDVSAKSPNPNAATVTNINNNVTPSRVTIYGREEGQTFINVYGADGSVDSIRVTVTAAPTKPKLLFSELSLQTGEIVYNDVLNTAPGATVTWTCSNTAVAQVSGTGKITAVKTGTATVTATTIKNGTSYKLSCKVTVNRADPDFINFIIRLATFKPSKKTVKISITNLSDADMIVYSGSAKLQTYPGFANVCNLKMKGATRVTIPVGKTKKITYTYTSSKVKGTKYDYGVRVKFQMEGLTYYARCVVDEDLGQYILKSNLSTGNWLFSNAKEGN